MTKTVATTRALRSLTALLAAHVVSQTGNVVTLFAVPFYVLATGGTGIEVGTAAFFATAPVIIGGPLGGVVVDRIGYRRASILADLISGVTVLAIPVLALTIGLPFWGLLALVFLSGLLDTPGQTARRVMLPAFSAEAHVRLERSVGFLDGAERLARLLGAPLGGILIAGIGPLNALFVNAGTFALSAMITWLFVARPLTGERMPAAAELPANDGYWSALAEGFRFVTRDPLLRAVVLLVLVTNVFDAARGSSLLPLYAHDSLGGAAAFGVLVAVMGGGALLGTVVFGFFAHRLPRRVTFSVCFALAGGPSLFAFAAGLPFPWLIAATALSGVAAGAINPILGTVELERVPEGMRARVFGLINAGAWAGVPAGALLGGIGADTVGLQASFFIIGVLYVVVTLLPLGIPVFREMEPRPFSQPAPAA
ncbi:MFS transporter [Cryobacterium glucosi]|uniref:MFS transporter n=1 Tax=Cryobacterium glucosi TaxID=1259175 RepID=A0ABY2ISJ7_9MICO|nr:MFS transporter [Cryobacterium glucosi]TFC23663.1 MFS transporter [Cryobacterium glucosi]